MSEGDGAERRRHERHDMQRSAVIAIFSEDRSSVDRVVWATARDLSQSGVGFLLASTLSKGTLIAISFANSDHSRSPAIYSEVRACRKLPTEWIHVGLEFCPKPAGLMIDESALFDGAEERRNRAA